MSKEELQNIRDSCISDDDFLTEVWVKMNLQTYIRGIYSADKSIRKKYWNERYKYTRTMALYNLYHKAIVYTMKEELIEYKEYYNL